MKELILEIGTFLLFIAFTAVLLLACGHIKPLPSEPMETGEEVLPPRGAMDFCKDKANRIKTPKLYWHMCGE